MANIINISSTTNRIIYNRILRSCRKILLYEVFELNDEYTRNNILVKIRALLSRAKAHAIMDFELNILDYDVSKPHYVEVHVVLYFKNMIEQVILRIDNDDSNL